MGHVIILHFWIPKTLSIFASFQTPAKVSQATVIFSLLEVANMRDLDSGLRSVTLVWCHDRIISNFCVGVAGVDNQVCRIVDYCEGGLRRSSAVNLKHLFARS